MSLSDSATGALRAVGDIVAPDPSVPPQHGAHRLRRRPELDILRCVAVALVLAHHFWLYPRWLYPLQKCGWIGVELFFVLSGYLVTGLVIKELRQKESFDWSRFMLRRIFKIWPSYYVFLITVMIVIASTVHISFIDAVIARWPSFLHIQNYANIDNFAGYQLGLNPLMRLGHTWSLGVEEHFYLLMPIGVALLATRGMAFLKKWLPIGLVSVAFVCFVLRLVNVRYHYSDLIHYWPTHVRLDGLCLGSLMTFCQQFYPKIWAKTDRMPRSLIVAGVILLLPSLRLSRESYWMNTVGFDMIAVGGACILRGMLTLGDNPNRFDSMFSRSVAWIGASSYSIYLWQFITAEWLVTKLPVGPWPIMLVAYFTSGLLGGVVLSKIIEFPALRLRDAWIPARARTPAPPPPSRDYKV